MSWRAQAHADAAVGAGEEHAQGAAAGCGCGAGAVVAGAVARRPPSGVGHRMTSIDVAPTVGSALQDPADPVLDWDSVRRDLLGQDQGERCTAARAMRRWNAPSARRADRSSGEGSPRRYAPQRGTRRSEAGPCGRAPHRLRGPRSRAPRGGRPCRPSEQRVPALTTARRPWTQALAARPRRREAEPRELVGEVGHGEGVDRRRRAAVLVAEAGSLAGGRGFVRVQPPAVDQRA